MDWLGVAGKVVAGLLVACIVGCVTYWRTRGRYLRALYRAMWKGSRTIAPEYVLGEIRTRNAYNPFFLPREEVGAIQKLLLNRKNVLVVGAPLSGKSRTVLEAFFGMPRPCDTTVAIWDNHSLP